MFEFVLNVVHAQGTLKINNLAVNIGWWPYLFSAVKYFFIFLTFVYILGIILVVIRSQSGFRIKLKELVEEAMEMGRLPKTKIQKEWEFIISSVESDSPEDYKKAVVKAENLFDRILRVARLSGENMERRLEKVPDSQLEFKEDVVWAHNLKKRILSGEQPEIEREEAKRAVYIFEKALKKTGAL